MSCISIIGVRIDHLVNAPCESAGQFRPRGPTARSPRSLSSVDCITSIGVLHDGQHFCALQWFCHRSSSYFTGRGLITRVSRAICCSSTLIRNPCVLIFLSSPSTWSIRVTDVSVKSPMSSATRSSYASRLWVLGFGAYRSPLIRSASYHRDIRPRLAS